MLHLLHHEKPAFDSMAIRIRGGKATVESNPIPDIPEDGMLVKVHSVALNPTDWKHIDFFPVEGAVAGCDYAGTVQSVGSQVTGLAAGDRVAGIVRGCDPLQPNRGAFAKYIVARAALHVKIPDCLSFEQACSLGTGIITVGLALYRTLGLDLPSHSGKVGDTPILIHGGSTASGTMAIQCAKLSGYRVIATSSPHNHDLLRSRGAAMVFDYKSSGCGQDIRRLTKGQIRFAFDCIGGLHAARLCTAAIGPQGGNMATVGIAQTFKMPRDDVQYTEIVGYTALGDRVEMGPLHWPASPGDFEFMKLFMARISDLLVQGQLLPHPIDVRSGGLSTIVNDLDDLRRGRISGEKIVVPI